MISTFQIIIIIHRVGFIITSVSATILPLLPYIFDTPSDEDFRSRAHQITRRISQFGLIILVLSGLARLQYGFPAWVVVKLLVVSIVITFYFGPYTQFKASSKQLLVSIFMLYLAATIGLIL